MMESQTDGEKGRRVEGMMEMPRGNGVDNDIDEET